jgi:MFS family permease
MTDTTTILPSGSPKGRFYYGWVQVGLAAVAMSATLPGRTYGLGLIKEPLRGDLGLSDLQFNAINFWAIVCGAAVVLPVGRLIDRLGSRGTLAIVTALLGLSVLLMARAASDWELAVALTLVRGFGQGALSVVAIALVGKWFRRRIGMAMGVFTLLLSVGFVLPIFLVGDRVQSHGWRSAWDAVAFALLCGLLPLGWVFARSSPEVAGVVPDAAAVHTDEGHAPQTVWDALKTRSFWVFTAAATLFNLTFSALTLDSEALLNEHGLDGAKTNPIVLGVLMVSGLPANIVAGFLARRMAYGKLLAGGLAMLAVSLLLFPFVNSVALAGVYAACLGVSGGVITVIFFAVYGHTFGRTHLGGIQSVVQVLTVFASAIGPVVLALVRDRNEGVTFPFFYACAAISLGCTVLAWQVRTPHAGT